MDASCYYWPRLWLEVIQPWSRGDWIFSILSHLLYVCYHDDLRSHRTLLVSSGVCCTEKYSGALYTITQQLTAVSIPLNCVYKYIYIAILGFR